MISKRRAVAPPFLAALLAGVLLFAGSPAARAQVSPGPLSTPHEALDGPTECFKCHAGTMAKTGMDERCLACHTEIAWMREQNRGAHTSGRLGTKECVSCHPEHGGRDFKLVVWDGGAPEKIDHQAKTGFALEGKHAVAQCAKCHTPANQKSGATPLIRRKDKTASWLGLETACEKCHVDFHRGQLGKDCAHCHDARDWKKPPTFDHAKSQFPLTGSHLKVECAKCHLAPAVVKEQDEKGQPLAQWKPLPHAACNDCHKDPHEGRFKDPCSKCHNTSAWLNFNKGGFNHDLTKYPLRGKHAAVECASCHDRTKAFGPKPKFAACTDCHIDVHAGKATLLAKVVDCASCHTVDGFEKPAYTVAAHAQSKFPLVGRHQAADCRKCHVRLADTPAVRTAWGPARVLMRPGFARCTPCHFDPHRGRFEPAGARPHKPGCADCHGMDGFAPSLYDTRKHATCVFPLNGAHQAVSCQTCHAELKSVPSGASLPADSLKIRALHFDNPRRKCVDCHESPHGKQFAWRKDHGVCEGCHDDRAFVPAAKFDHGKDARFRLEGAHLKAPCSGCHSPQKDASGKNFTIYRPTPMNCESCHAAGLRDSTAVPRPKGKTS
jgi:hypothetical protein